MAKEALNTFWRVFDENVIIALNNGLLCRTRDNGDAVQRRIHTAIGWGDELISTEYLVMVFGHDTSPNAGPNGWASKLREVSQYIG